MDTRKLKQYNTQVSKLISDSEVLKTELTLKQKEYQQKLNSIKEVKEKINKLKPKEIVVSEHAILRYLERVEGICLEEIKKKILTPELYKMVDVIGSEGKFPIKDFQVIIRDNVVVTINK